VDDAAILKANIGSIPSAVNGIDFMDIFSFETSSTSLFLNQGNVDITANYQLFELFRSKSAHPFISNPQMIYGVLDFSEMFGSPLVLDGRASPQGNRLRVRVTEDLSGLVSFRMTAVGRRIQPTELQ